MSLSCAGQRPNILPLAEVSKSGCGLSVAKGRLENRTLAVSLASSRAECSMLLLRTGGSEPAIRLSLHSSGRSSQTSFMALHRPVLSREDHADAGLGIRADRGHSQEPDSGLGSSCGRRVGGS